MGEFSLQARIATAEAARAAAQAATPEESRRFHEQVQQAVVAPKVSGSDIPYTADDHARLNRWLEVQAVNSSGKSTESAPHK